MVVLHTYLYNIYILCFVKILTLYRNGQLIIYSVGDSINENRVCRCMQLNLRGDIASTYYFRPKRPMRVTAVHVELLS